ncbi:MAG: transglycosylase SLT domain-containing protein [Myxococcales bacterium]|nr:transglycosylase SLT domain-containing protein [Myxococcales bacterium]USN51536.1 MAG: transglycosylase SLT domain-containing protein [Myxococcales bacterium]
MKNWLIFFSLALVLLFFNACLAKKIIKPSDPCLAKEFAQNISHYTSHELLQLEKLLKNRFGLSQTQYGCQSALLGKLYMAQGRMNEASSSFGIAAQKLPDLQDYFMLAKAKTEFKNSNLQIAQKIVESVLKSKHSSAFVNKAHRLLADIALAKQEDTSIVETHRQILRDSGAKNKDHLFNLALSLSKLGNTNEADDVFKQLLIRFPTSLEAQKATELRGKHHLKLTIDEHEKRFNQLIAKMAFDQAVADADQALRELKSSDDEKRKSIYNSFAVKSLILNNKFEQGIERAAQRALSPQKTPKDLETYAWALGKVDRLVEAADYYSRFAQSSSDKKEKERGCFFVGFSLYEANLYSMANYSWQQCQHLITDSKLKEKTLWYQALSSMLIGHFDHAQTLLAQLVKKSSSCVHEKYVYFLGYSLHQLHRKNAGDALLRSLAQKKQPSYYVMLSRNFLGLKKIKGQTLSADALSQLASKCQKPVCQNAHTLYHLGFGDEARDLVMASSLKNEDKLAMLQQFGNYHEVWQRSYLLHPQTSIKNASLHTDYKIRASYPLPHKALIKRMSHKYNVPENLLYAIIHTESAFLTDAKSYRGALGLMQMMPFVAHDLAAKLDLKQFSTNHLKDPKISLELGALFLATLKRQFDGNHLVIAAYNAGAHQMQKWIDRFGHLPPEFFVERIPFEQTRAYVKKVMPSASLYAALDGKDLNLIF